MINSISSGGSSESACNAGELGSISGWGRSPGEGNGSPLQYSCLKNPMDRGAWRATVHGVTRVRHDLETEPPGTVWEAHGERTLDFPERVGKRDVLVTAEKRWSLKEGDQVPGRPHLPPACCHHCSTLGGEGVCSVTSGQGPWESRGGDGSPAGSLNVMGTGFLLLLLSAVRPGKGAFVTALPLTRLCPDTWPTHP